LQRLYPYRLFLLRFIAGCLEPFFLRRGQARSLRRQGFILGYFPLALHVSIAEDDRGLPMLEGRIVPDDATYQRILEIARIHCPEIVKHIEKEKQKCLVEGA
jgi:hypothetical protein